MKLSKVWSPYDAKQLSEEAGYPPKSLLPTGEDPTATSIDSLTLPIVYTPYSPLKPQPGSTIQSQGVEAIYSLLSIIDDLAESLVGKDKWKSIYEDEQGKLNATAPTHDKRLPVLISASSITNRELIISATKFFRQVDAVANTINRTQLNLKQSTPIDHGLETETEYKRFNINLGTDTLNSFLRYALQAIDTFPGYQSGSQNDPGCVLCIPDDHLTSDKSRNVYTLTARDTETLNSLFIPGDIVKIFGQYYVLSLSGHAHELMEPAPEQQFMVRPCTIANYNSVHASASLRLERQMQGSRWKDEPLLKELNSHPVFCCFTQCTSIWSAMSPRQDFCVIATFFKGNPHELGHFPLSALQVVKYLASYDHKEAVLRFIISDGSQVVPSGAGAKGTSSEKSRTAIKELTDSRSDIDTAVSSLYSSTAESSALSSLTSDYMLETDSGCCGREADEFFSNYDVNDYAFLDDQNIWPPSCSINSSELLEALREARASADSTSSTSMQQKLLSNFHSALQSISYGVSLMYEAPVSISREYIVWIDAMAEQSVEVLYLYDRSVALRRPLLTLNLRKLFSHYLKKSTKSEEHLNGITCMPIVQSVYAIGLPHDHVLLIMVPHMSGSFFFCSFRKEEAPSSADVCIVAQRSVIDIVNVDLLQTHGLIFVSTRTITADSHNKINSSTQLHILSLVYSYTDLDQTSTTVRDVMFKKLRFTVLFKPIHTLFLTNAGHPTKGIVLLDSLRLAIYFESLSYFYIVDCESIRNYESHELEEAPVYQIPVAPIYTVCRSIDTLLYNHDGEHIILFEYGETQAFVYSQSNLKEPKYSIILPAGDRINYAAPGGDNGLIALSGDHTVSMYRLGASEIFLKHFVTRGRAIGMVWATPTSLLVATEQVLYTITLNA